MLTNATISERYTRQVMLPEIGMHGQQKLLEAKVLVVGAGGLGCPVLQYLAAAGAGTIGIVDDDVVAISNLHRQVLFGVNDIGKSKAACAAEKLGLLNDGITTEVYQVRLQPLNAWEIISRYDLVVDGSDNFATRYLVNDICVLQQKPLVYGSIFRFEGQVAVFNCKNTIQYRDLFAEKPAEDQVPNCAEAGVLGVLTGVIGCLMANEAIKIITQTGHVLSGKLLTYQSQYNQFYEMDISPNDNKQYPKTRGEIETAEYGGTCSSSTAIAEIDVDTFDELLSSPATLVIDVREDGELPLIKEFEHISMPLSSIQQGSSTAEGDTIIFFCQSGQRSRRAAEIFAAGNPHLTKIFTLKGGIQQWKSRQQTPV